MGKYDKLILRVLRGNSDANITFRDLCELLKNLGFDENTKGSHYIFRKDGIEEKINLQKDGSKAKPYQVRQVRTILVKYRFSGEE